MNDTMLIYSAETARKCGTCSACCKLLPVRELNKPANTRCKYQRLAKGCTIYDRKPMSCATYSCRWLLGNDTADMPRPDRCHYVLDPMPDFVRAVKDGELVANIEVVQVWVDPDYPDAYRDPALRRYLMRRAAQGVAAVIRYGSKDGFTLVAPPMTEGDWIEYRGTQAEPQHSFEDYAAAAEENKALAAKRSDA